MVITNLLLNHNSQAIADEEVIRKTESTRESFTNSPSGQLGNVNTASWGSVSSGTGGAADPRREENLHEFEEKKISQSQSVSTPDFDMITGDPFELQAIDNALPSPVPAVPAAFSPTYGLKRPTNLLQLNNNDNPQELLVDPSSAMSAPSWHTHPVECLHPSENPSPPPSPLIL